MGQYYTPLILADNRDEDGHEQIRHAFFPFEFGQFLKLMEHSYVGNDLVNVVTAFLAARPGRLVWAGDYADPEPRRTVTRTLPDGETRKFEANLHSLDACLTRPHVTVGGVEAVGVARFRERGAVYTVADVNVEATVDLDRTCRFLADHDRREYVDVEVVPENGDMAGIHPLPLLTAEGNGYGGGDYRGDAGAQWVGAWARHHIQAVGAPPAGYAEIRPGFIEHRVPLEATV